MVVPCSCESNVLSARASVPAHKGSSIVLESRVDYSSLKVERMVSDEELRKKARDRAKDKNAFYAHFLIYVVVPTFLWAQWY